MNAFAFIDGEWKQARSVYCFHEGIGFVKLHSIKVFSNGEWRVVEEQPVNRELIGAVNG